MQNADAKCKKNWERKKPKNWTFKQNCLLVSPVWMLFVVKVFYVFFFTETFLISYWIQTKMNFWNFQKKMKTFQQFCFHLNYHLTMYFWSCYQMNWKIFYCEFVSMICSEMNSKKVNLIENVNLRWNVTLWKLKKSTLTIDLQKFREINTFHFTLCCFHEKFFY